MSKLKEGEGEPDTLLHVMLRHGRHGYINNELLVAVHGEPGNKAMHLP